MNEHWYYLHTNGELIHKSTWPGEDNSDFVRKIWPCDISNRAHAWTIILESLGLGANVERVRELADRWQCDGKDLTEYMRRITDPPKAERDGIRIFLKQIIGVDPDVWFDWLAKTPKGGDPDFNSMPTGEVVTPALVPS